MTYLGSPKRHKKAVRAALWTGSARRRQGRKPVMKVEIKYYFQMVSDEMCSQICM